jgi:hypothetical protein
MRTLPTEMIRVLTPFAPLFSRRVFRHVQVLVAGARIVRGSLSDSETVKVPRAFIERLTEVVCYAA